MRMQTLYSCRLRGHLLPVFETTLSTSVHTQGALFPVTKIWRQLCWWSWSGVTCSQNSPLYPYDWTPVFYVFVYQLFPTWTGTSVWLLDQRLEPSSEVLSTSLPSRLNSALRLDCAPTMTATTSTYYLFLPGAPFILLLSLTRTIRGM